MDLALKRLLLVRSRSEGKEACDVGAVTVNGARAKASTDVHAGDRIGIEYADRSLAIELTGEIGSNVSRVQARTLYRVLRDDRAPGVDA